MKNKKWLVLAILLAIILPIGALIAPTAMQALFWKIGAEPAIAVLQGEHVGQIIRLVLLAISPFVPILCFLLERLNIQWNRWRQSRRKLPEFATEEERRAFYLKELQQERQATRGFPWIVYAILCGIGVSIFHMAVLDVMLSKDIEKAGKDLAAYYSGQPAIYEGPLLLSDYNYHDGLKSEPDKRFVYYENKQFSSTFRCAASLIAQPNLMQDSYTVAYLPETRTILSITDQEGNVRTTGDTFEFPTPPGCWMYGDLAVPICDEVHVYSDFSPEQQALFDLLYSEVLSEGVATGKFPTRAFKLPYPLKKEDYKAVVAVYNGLASPEQRKTHNYQTDDGRIVRRAYCAGIVHMDPKS